ncbi:MAG: tRNA uridine-5-carboxymethylaminomethyl(34) synthesis enzyme MnmG [Erysipelotrichaceae bacterium]|nr:tRNA uridine-5-carboxymethylaminomethyl(34) synthesis enzyme MnmG [Erysipelotrichaceae bacterium]
MYDVIVVGGGHAGCEAALASARIGMKTALYSMNIDMIASMPCNPSVGGPAKGIVVREIDALGGEMGRNADLTALQFKMLNTTKGPGVRSLRVQSDKIEYKKRMQEVLLHQENLDVKCSLVERVVAENGKIKGILLEDGTLEECKALILTTGTYMSGKVMVGSQVNESGPDQERTTKNLSQSLRDLGLRTFRLKTGTPPRVYTNTIDFSKAQEEPGTPEFYHFSYQTKKEETIAEPVLCYLIYTQPETHKIIKENIHRSSMYSGIVEGVGPRYCPSIEDKLVRFADKERHQLFLEPESLSLDTTYVQGFSTSLPYDVQEKMIHTLPGLEHCVVKKYAYAIEYDAIDPLQLKPTLEVKTVENLYCAGQIIGTSGYEEAAGLGLMAGINACLKLQEKEPLILRRDESYIGVMIDDLVTKGTKEPYRLLTSRAEYRLLLRHDNADKRLTEYGKEAGLVKEQQYRFYTVKIEHEKELRELCETRHIRPCAELDAYLKECGYDAMEKSMILIELVRRPRVELGRLLPYVSDLPEYSFEEISDVEIEIKYEGYISKERKEADKLAGMENIKLSGIDFRDVPHLSLEARQKLLDIEPATLGQASRISGVNPADIAVLAVYIKQMKR